MFKIQQIQQTKDEELTLQEYQQEEIIHQLKIIKFWVIIIGLYFLFKIIKTILEISAVYGIINLLF